MTISRLIAAIFLTLVSPIAGDPGTSRGSRKKKCPGCAVTLENHTFGDQNADCEGPLQQQKQSSATPPSSKQSSATILKATPTPADPKVDFKREQLRQLELEQQRLMREISFEEKKLDEEIARRKTAIEQLKAVRKSTSNNHPHLQEESFPPPQPRDQSIAAHSAAILDSSMAPLLPPNNVSTLLGNISSLLGPNNESQGHPSQPHQQQSINPLFSSSFPTTSASSNNPVDQSELFLRPTRANDVTRGKALRIVDFVSRIRPSEDEKILSYDNNCKLTLTLQDRKPKLSSVTVEQFNIANLRIFYELLFSGKLSTLRDIQEYLSYVIKILELANKYTWESVLLYDDEFRILQHTYGFSWATDHSHLHEAVLMPRWAAHLSRNKQGSPSYLSPYNNSDSGYKHHNFVTHLSSGSEICRLFNCRKGCQRPQCKFSHVCNRKVGSQACGKNHAGVSHPPDNQDQ